MPKVIANDLEIYYERRGQGKPLLYISGTGADLRNTPNQFDSPLGIAFDLIAYDQRGLGQTGKPSGRYTMADYADDAAALLDALEIEQIAVMGVSFGGMVAQELVLRHAERVSQLVLACTSSGGAGGASYPLHELEGLPAAERAQRHLKIADLRHTDTWIEAHPEAWQRRIHLSMAARRSDRDETGAAQQLDARRHHNTFARLPGLSVPVLLTGGVYDGIAPVENLRQLQQQIPDSELRLYEGGHLFLIQDKLAYPQIVDWLNGLG